MKNRILTSLLLMLLPLLVVAQNIDESEAAAIAERILGKSVVNVSAATTRAVGTQPFYNIYAGEDGNGFAIISTDRRAPKVIGYGDSKVDASNLPPQLKAILEKQDSVLHATPSLPEHPSWKQQMTRADEGSGKLLKTANWGQGYPYNLMTPEIDGEHCPTGCVATAMAIIMKYHGWPEKGRGDHTYNWNDQDLSFDYANTTFNWTQMPEEFIDGEFTEAQAQEVSKLMRAAGNAIDMRYDSYGSEGIIQAIPYNFYRYFKYNLPKAYVKNPQYASQEFIEDTKWINTIKSEIDKQNPVFYSSQALNHAFVIDGYDNLNLFHINWGWATTNGYFDLNEIMGADTDQRILTGLTPEKAAKDEYEEIFIGTSDVIFGSGGSIGMSFETGEFEEGKFYYLKCMDVWYPRGTTANVSLAVISENNEIKTILDDGIWLWQEEYYSNIHSGSTFICGFIMPEFSPTDKFQVIYRKTEDSPWKICHALGEAVDNIPLTGYVPLYNIVEWKCDDGVNIYIQDQLVSPGNLPTKLVKNFNIGVDVTSDIGVPSIYVDGRKVSNISFSRMGRMSVWASIEPNKDQTVEIRNTLFADMKDFDIEVSVPGSLKDLINEDDAKITNTLKVSGIIDVTDLSYISQNFNLLSKLDLTNVEISPDNIMPDGCLANTGLISELYLPNNIIGFGNYAFYNLQGLKTIIIPEKVTQYGEDLFFWCESLKTVVVKNPVPAKIYNSTFFNITSIPYQGTLYVPKGSKSAYENADIWKEFPNIIEYEGEWKEITLAEEIRLNKSDISLEIGTTETLTATVLPENTTDKTVTWTSSDESVATVSAEGVVTAVKAGTATITATCGDVSATCVATVTPTIGDANGDGEYTVSDVTYTIERMMDNLAEGNEFYDAAADIDGDGEVLIPDLTAIIDLVLAAKPASAPTRSANVGYIEDAFSISNIEQKEDGIVIFKLKNESEFVASQFDVVLPEGCEIEKVLLTGQNDNTHNIAYRKLTDNLTRVLIYSMSNQKIEENFAEIYVNTLKSNTDEIVLTNIRGNVIDDSGLIMEYHASDVYANPTGLETVAGGISICIEGKTVIINSDSERTVVIANMQGITKNVKIRPGVTKITLPSEGIYLIDNKKFLVR